MPLRYASLPAALRLGVSTPAQWPQPQLLACSRRRPFHSTSALRDDEIDAATNHYETLKLAPGATAAEIKKSFYALSKTHHPDHNRSDLGAANRFMRISEAYNTLSSAEKRSRYDRDTLGLHRSSHQGRRGSYSSTSSQAGGRPATGLSRRRTTFTGPPPSFYRSGGWGSHGAKRSAAQDDSTGGASASSSSSSSSAHAKDHHNDGAWATSGSGGFGAGGMGPGQDPFRHRDDVPHFDREGHERTGRRTEERRWRRMRVDGEDVRVESERGPTGMFLVIGGVLALSFLGPLALSRAWNSGREKRKFNG
ncbi:hypothetical protein BJ170DRAFT_191022 [Xylariales sp. AK1849]|nr:hypothetical protein BJ170DRAFT_191022 [Xylariales sp. AK1849]